MYFVYPDFGQTLFWTLYMYMCVCVYIYIYILVILFEISATIFPEAKND